MSAGIIGIPENKMKFHQRTFFREAVGLERIQEEYIFPTSLFERFSSNVLFNGAKQKDIAEFIDWSSGEKILYEKMVIERIEYQPIPGSLIHAFVTYVGLYSTNAPKPIISIQGILDKNWLFNNYAVIVQFVADIGEPGSLSEIRAISQTYKRGTIHTAINGFVIPQGVARPSNFPANSPMNWNLGWLNCPTLREQCFEDPNTQEQTLTPIIGTVNYGGFSVYSVTMERFGLFGVFRLDIRDQAFYVIEGTSGGGCGDVLFSACFSYLNIPIPGFVAQ